MCIKSDEIIKVRALNQSWYLNNISCVASEDVMEVIIMMTTGTFMRMWLRTLVQTKTVKEEEQPAYLQKISNQKAVEKAKQS